MVWIVLSCLAGSSTAWGQREPRIGYVFPAGLARGTEAELTIGGRYLDGATNLHLSGGGIRSTVLEHIQPLTQRERNSLREQLQELLKAAPAEQDPEAIAALRTKLARPKQPTSPQLAETVRIRVTVSPETRPGRRELRLLAGAGLSNPLVFWVGQDTEVLENDRETKDQPALALPTVVNGQILAGDVDRFRFRGRAGQRIVASVRARELIPYLADAVPGWFQATLTLFDAAGHELAYADDAAFDPDPVLSIELPTDGDYEVEIKDAIYRGREDFVYRLTLGELPWVRSVFPIGARSGTSARVRLSGWNLAKREMEMELAADTVGLVHLLPEEQAPTLNRWPFAVDPWPEIVEVEPNDQASTARAIPLGTVVNGRIDTPGDQDLFQIDGRAGQVLVAEVMARRLRSPLDSVLTVTDAQENVLGANDDNEDPGFGLLTHHADSRLQVTLPRDGAYRVQLRDAQHQGSAAHAYRLRISPPQPDFALRGYPSTVNLRPGASVPITIVALRYDGFAADISLSLEGASKDLVLSGGWIPAGQDRIRCTLTASPTLTGEPVEVRIEGHAPIGNREARRRVVPADEMTQAFINRHLVPAQGWWATVSGRAVRQLPTVTLPGDPVRLSAGGETRIPVGGGPRRSLPEGLELQLSKPPDGIRLRGLLRSQRGWELVVATDGGKVQPGLKGNLILEAFMKRTGLGNTVQGARVAPRTRLGVLPALPFEVVPVRP